MGQIYLYLVVVIICVGIMIVIESIRSAYTYYRIKQERKRQSEKTIYYDAVKRENSMLLDIQKQSQQMHNSIHRVEQWKTGDFSISEDNIRQKTVLITSFLDDYEKQAEAHNIRFEETLEIESEFPCNAVDTISLLGNLLDNALESCRHVQRIEGKARTVWIRVTLQSLPLGKTTVIRLQVENSKQRESKPLENRFATTKENSREHGKGVMIVKEIVKRYGGTILFEDREDVFVIRIEFVEEKQDV